MWYPHAVSRTLYLSIVLSLLALTLNTTLEFIMRVYRGGISMVNVPCRLYRFCSSSCIALRHSIACGPCSAFVIDGGIMMSRAKIVCVSGVPSSSRVCVCRLLVRIIDSSMYITCVVCWLIMFMSSVVCLSMRLRSFSSLMLLISSFIFDFDVVFVYVFCVVFVRGFLFWVCVVDRVRRVCLCVYVRCCVCVSLWWC